MKKEIIKMLIPLIGVWWVFENIIDFCKEKEIGVVGTMWLFFYQLSCWIGWEMLLEYLTDIGYLPIQIHL